MTTITINQAKEIVKSLTFSNVPNEWTLDLDRIAKAYKNYRKHVNHDTAVSQIDFYLHHFKAYSS